MTIPPSSPRQDWALLRTPATKLAVALICSAFFVTAAYYFRISQQAALQTARTVREARAANLRQVKDEKQTIDRHISQFQKIEADGLMGGKPLGLDRSHQSDPGTIQALSGADRNRTAATGPWRSPGTGTRRQFAGFWHRPDGKPHKNHPAIAA